MEKEKSNRANPRWSDYHWEFLTALGRHHGLTQCQVIKLAVSQMIERIPEDGPLISKKYLKKLFDSMTPEERKHPEK